MARSIATAEDLRLKDQMLPLILGIYAWGDRAEKHQTKYAGSGIFVAPGLALTAKHVAQSFQRLEAGYEAAQRRKDILDTEQYKWRPKKGEYAALVYQITGEMENPSEEKQILWKPTVSWPSFDTDISVLKLDPRSPASVEKQRQQQYFVMHLTPPPPGQIVRIYGFPEAIHEIDGDDHQTEVNLEIYPARVESWIYPMEAHALTDFPAFTLDRPFAHGFSGGPVLWNDKLVGIFSGAHNAVASLWPLALMQYPEAEQDNVRQSFAEHFDNGLISASDWDDVNGNVERAPCAEATAGLDIEPCDKKHIVATGPLKKQLRRER